MHGELELYISRVTITSHIQGYSDFSNFGIANYAECCLIRKAQKLA